MRSAFALSETITAAFNAKTQRRRGAKSLGNGRHHLAGTGWPEAESGSISLFSAFLRLCVSALNSTFCICRVVPISCLAVALVLGVLPGQAAPAPVVLTDVSRFGFPDFLSALNSSSKGWVFAPPFVGLKWVELNGVLLKGNSGSNDPRTGLTFTTTPTNYVISGFDWTDTEQRPARNGICRGGLHGNRLPLGLKFQATPGHRYLVEILALGAAAQKRSFNVVVDGQTAVKDWTILADPAANRLLRIEVEAGAPGIALQFTPGAAAGADTNPAITAVALTDTTDGLLQYDPIFGRVPAGLENIARLGTASSPDGLEQDGDGRGDRAAIDGDPNTYWDEQDGAPLYRLVVSYKQPEKIAALAVMGWGQHAFAPKDFEVLCDGKPVRKIENARYTQNVLLLPIEETVCRSVEIKITGYYGGSPAVRELGIFRRINQTKPDYRVLVFSKTLGYRHANIPLGVEAIRRLGLENNFAVDATEDSVAFTSQNLSRYKAVLLLSVTGDVFNNEQEAALRSYVEGGGGFAAIHGAIYGPGACEDKWAWYGELCCTAFKNHSAIVPARVDAEDRTNPSMAGLPDRWFRTDEWYNYNSNPRACARVVATVDESTYAGGTLGEDHPIAWCRRLGRGAVWYTAMGHTDASFQDPFFLLHVLGGIQLVAGVKPADFTPRPKPAKDLRQDRLCLHHGSLPGCGMDRELRPTKAAHLRARQVQALRQGARHACERQHSARRAV